MKFQSKYSVEETLDRLGNILSEKGIKIVARVNHAAAAKTVEMQLRPTELLLFGNPVLGTPLMQANQEAGFDLPMKALAWQNQDGEVWLRVTEPTTIATSNGLEGVDEIIKKMTGALQTMARASTL